MSRVKTNILLSLFFVAGLIYIGIHFASVQRQDTSANPLVPTSAPDTPTSVRTSPSNPERSPEKTAFPKDQVAKPPSISALQDEVKKDVHVTPPSLLRFGADMGVRMQDAKQNQAVAIGLLKELKTCTQPAKVDDSPVQARALCLVSARELEQTWPSLHDDVEDLIKNADLKAVQLASKLQGFSVSPPQ